MLVRSAVYMLLAALVLAARAQGAPPSANMAREPGLFAYEALSGGIFTIRSDGTDRREVLPSTNAPAWNPDGTRLGYVSSPSGITGEGGLWWARPDGTDPHLIITPERLRGQPPGQYFYSIGSPAWSPSGRRVAFEAISSDEHERSVSTVGTVAVDGSRPRMLRNGSEPDWLPSGRRIAFIKAAKSRWSLSSRIATMRRDGSDVRVLLGDDKGYRNNLDVSPDGRRLAFTESKNSPGFQPNFLRIMSLRTGRTTTIPLSKTGVVRALTWTPGGTRIAYVVTFPIPGRPSSSVYTIRPDGTGRELLFTLSGDEHIGGDALSWQPPQ